MSLKRYHTELWRGFEQEDFELLRRSLSVLERFPIQRTRQALERWKNYLILLEVERKRIRDETRAKEVMAVISNSKRLERTFHEKETIRYICYLASRMYQMVISDSQIWSRYLTLFLV